MLSSPTEILFLSRLSFCESCSSLQMRQDFLLVFFIISSISFLFLCIVHDGTHLYGDGKYALNFPRSVTMRVLRIPLNAASLFDEEGLVSVPFIEAIW